MSCASPAVSTTSGSQPSSSAIPRPIWATSRECVSRVRGTPLTSAPSPGPTTCVLPASRRSAAECSTRARSRENGLRRSTRPGCFARLGDAARPVVLAGVVDGGHPRPEVVGVHRGVREPVVEQRGGLADDVAGLRLPGLDDRAAARRRGPRRRARCRGPWCRARSECHGSQTISARFQPVLRGAGGDGLQAAQRVRADRHGDHGRRRHPELDQVAAARLGLGVGVAGAAAARGDDAGRELVVVERGGVPQARREDRAGLAVVLRGAEHDDGVGGLPVVLPRDLPHAERRAADDEEGHDEGAQHQPSDPGDPGRRGGGDGRGHPPMRTEDAASAAPARPPRTAMTCATIDTAVSAAVRAPRSSPTGP